MNTSPLDGYAGEHVTARQAQRIAMADGMRGLAALWVVLFHMAEGGHLPALKSALPGLLWTFLFEWGDLGVPVFFVLSGFVMAATAVHVRFDPLLAGRFILLRLIRLSPPYYFAIAVALAFAYARASALGGSPPDVQPRHVVEHIAYAQLLFSSPVINTVFWTLCIEVQFYIAFALMMSCADMTRWRYGRYAAAAVASLLSLLWPLGMTGFAPWPGHFLEFWYAFLAGVLVYWGGRHGGTILEIATAYCLFLLFTGLFIDSGFAVAVAVAALLLLIAGAAGKMATWLSWPRVQLLGLVSYSLYLLHNPLTGASFWAIRKFLPAGPHVEIVGLVAVTAICCISSWFAYLIVERPSIAWSHRISMRNPEPANVATPSVPQPLPDEPSVVPPSGVGIS